MSPDSLPVKLRQLRGTMSLAEAAERSQIPEHRLRMYEEGVRQPYTKTLKRLAEAYGVPASELVPNGAVAAPAQAPAAAPPRRRRRRRRVADQNGERSVEVPVEVRPGERVRIVIELIVRPAAGTVSPEAAAVAPTVAVTAPAVAEEAAAAHPRPRLPAPPPTAERAPPRDLAAAPPGPGARRPLQSRNTEAGAASAGSSDVRDPLAEFRRAYGEFRRSRKP